MSLSAQVINSLLDQHEQARERRYAAQRQALARFQEQQARELKMFTDAQEEERKLIDDHFAMAVDSALRREIAHGGQLDSNPPAQA
jgi:hypothetical protein